MNARRGPMLLVIFFCGIGIESFFHFDMIQCRVVHTKGKKYVRIVLCFYK